MGLACHVCLRGVHWPGMSCVPLTCSSAWQIICTILCLVWTALSLQMRLSPLWSPSHVALWLTPFTRVCSASYLLQFDSVIGLLSLGIRQTLERPRVGVNVCMCLGAVHKAAYGVHRLNQQDS